MKAARLIGELALLQLCCCGVTLGFVEYGNGATWERELPACASARSVCSLVHRRYWLSPLEIRLCRCPHKEPCPGGFETAPSAWAVNITSRTQLKMCSAWQPTNCTSDQTSLIMRTTRTFPSPERQGTKEIHADVLCQCAQDRDVYYRRTHGNNTADLTYYEQRQYFRCAPLSECKAGASCGHITRDFYATYKTCHCPTNHLCTVPQGRNRKVENVREAMYEGAAYQALCLPR